MSHFQSLHLHLEVGVEPHIPAPLNVHMEQRTDKEEVSLSHKKGIVVDV